MNKKFPEGNSRDLKSFVRHDINTRDTGFRGSFWECATQKVLATEPLLLPNFRAYHAQRRCPIPKICRKEAIDRKAEAFGEFQNTVHISPSDNKDNMF
jgi:hypothetical protein